MTSELSLSHVQGNIPIPVNQDLKLSLKSITTIDVLARQGGKTRGELLVYDVQGRNSGIEDYIVTFHCSQAASANVMPVFEGQNVRCLNAKELPTRRALVEYINQRINTLTEHRKQVGEYHKAQKDNGLLERPEKQILSMLQA